VPVLTSSGSIALAALLGKPWGMDRSVRRAPTFYGLIIVSIAGAIAISLFASNPVQLLVLSATINGIAAAPFLTVVMLVAGDRRLMGRYVNGALARTLGWLTTAIMLVAGVLGLYTTIAQP
jgi:Mn2+/Fe2+ NRAMP family transporter